MAVRIGYETDALHARPGAVLIRIVAVVHPDGVDIPPVIALDAKVSLDHGPVLLEVVMGLLVQAGFKRLAEEKAHADQKDGEDDRVNGGQSEAKAAGNVLAFGQKALRRLLYTCVSSWSSAPVFASTVFSGASIM